MGYPKIGVLILLFAMLNNCKIPDKVEKSQSSNGFDLTEEFEGAPIMAINPTFSWSVVKLPTTEMNCVVIESMGAGHMLLQY